MLPNYKTEPEPKPDNGLDGSVRGELDQTEVDNHVCRKEQYSRTQVAAAVEVIKGYSGDEVVEAPDGNQVIETVPDPEKFTSAQIWNPTSF